ncbi:MAG TPA: helix-turn-helix transcriptional regulator [Tepidisphaeraceae bacterium]|jgi:hypothetical protein|nr:helix-turn-helix transcriptional regulator [Tepidisphaeraceae bacterium]
MSSKNYQNTLIASPFEYQRSKDEIQMQSDSPVARVIVRLMEENKIRPIDIIRGTGLSPATVFRHLKGKPEASIDKRERYAKVFGLSPEQFEELWKAESRCHKDEGETPKGQ